MEKERAGDTKTVTFDDLAAAYLQDYELQGYRTLDSAKGRVRPGLSLVAKLPPRSRRRRSAPIRWSDANGASRRQPSIARRPAYHACSASPFTWATWNPCRDFPNDCRKTRLDKDSSNIANISRSGDTFPHRTKTSWTSRTTQDGGSER